MNTILKKMKIKAPHVLYAYNNFAMLKDLLGELPEGIRLVKAPAKQFDSLHWFVKSRAEVDAQTAAVLHSLKPGMQVWCYYPKGSSGVQTDLTRDKGWDTLMGHDTLRWLSLISIDETWSAFAFRLKTDKDIADEKKPAKVKEITRYADPVSKTIALPDDMARALMEHPEARELFDGLAYSHRREYVEWVISAKREETRRTRVQGTIEKLLIGKKNPSEK